MPSVGRYWKKLCMLLMFLCCHTVSCPKQSIGKVHFPVRVNINTLIMWIEEPSDFLLVFSLLALVYCNLKSRKTFTWGGLVVMFQNTYLIMNLYFYKVNFLFLYHIWIELTIRSSFSPRCDHWGRQQLLSWKDMPTDTIVPWMLWK